MGLGFSFVKSSHVLKRARSRLPDVSFLHKRTKSTEKPHKCIKTFRIFSKSLIFFFFQTTARFNADLNITENVNLTKAIASATDLRKNQVYTQVRKSFYQLVIAGKCLLLNGNCFRRKSWPSISKNKLINNPCFLGKKCIGIKGQFPTGSL